jgi:hypothetical protein
MVMLPRCHAPAQRDQPRRSILLLSGLQHYLESLLKFKLGGSALLDSSADTSFVSSRPAGFLTGIAFRS